MGNAISISIPLDGLFSGSWNCIPAGANYVRELEKNFHALETEMEELTDLKNDVKRRVRLAEEQLMTPLDKVQRWISRVEDAEVDFTKVIEDGAQEIEKLCIGGCCSKNCKSSYKFGKEVAQKLEYVATLKSNGVFEMVADTVPSALVDLRPSEPTVGMESMFDKVWSCLRQEKVGIVGLFGVGGVGKTTLLTQINNQFYNTPSKFDFVFWVLVPKDLNYLQTIQHAIGEKIGLRSESWKEKSQNDQKAMDIHKILSKKKFVLLMDDLWERVDLLDVGVPFPNEINNCKLVFTTRSKEVCSLMDAQEKIEVTCLSWEKAWKLFEKKVGDETLGSHPDIPKLAEIVAKECGGLPLTLINIGRAMAFKFTTEEWNRAIHILKNSASTFPDIRFSTDFSAMVGTLGGRVGTIGGQGGAKWDDGSYDGIRQIIIVSGSLIDSIQVEYAKDGGSVWGVKHGGKGGPTTAKVELDFPDEYLTLVLGYYSSNFTAMKVIHSLEFMSNKRTFGPFGHKQEGNKFIISASNGKIVGFFGRSGIWLDAIGAHVQHIPSPKPNFFESIGPFGGEGEKQWEDGIYTTIREILIWSESVIDSIRIHYDKDGSSVWSPMHGGSSGGQLQMVKFDYPNEFLILISGCYGTYLGKTIIHSLTFQTNKKIYGPFGTKNENQFSIPSNGGKIVGFFGSSSTFIDSIGANVQTISHP